MANKVLSAKEILATIEGFVSNEDNIGALEYVESIILPIISNLENSTPLEVFHTLLYNISKIYYLNQEYEISQHYLDALSSTEYRQQVNILQLNHFLNLQ